LDLNVGQKVYYTGRGPCLVDALIRKSVCGASAMFYSLTLLDDSGTEFLVPAASCSDLPLRALLAPEDIPRLLSRLRTRVGPPQGLASWRQRQSVRSKLFSSGSAFDLADVIESLTRSTTIRKLSVDEWETLRRARKLLISEIAEVMNETKSAAEARLEHVTTTPDKKVMKKRGDGLRFNHGRKSE
jgi:CarD family transcriptional regulator